MTGLLKEIAGILEAVRLSKPPQEPRRARRDRIVIFNRDVQPIDSEGDAEELGGDGGGWDWDFGGWFD